MPTISLGIRASLYQLQKAHGNSTQMNRVIRAFKKPALVAFYLATTAPAPNFHSSCTTLLANQPLVSVPKNRRYLQGLQSVNLACFCVHRDIHSFDKLITHASDLVSHDFRQRVALCYGEGEGFPYAKHQCGGSFARRLACLLSPEPADHRFVLRSYYQCCGKVMTTN